ncbi:MAG: hydantoinase B/oxoprolinase family protein [Planctomycetaceae bacterium]|nr:hydantoinase B/oxoprolinase family protein [Planctomycetaceae bacterium]
MTTPWEFWIDVGGTFTDCLARTPENVLVTAKVLSSGLTKGTVNHIESRARFTDSSRVGEPDNRWRGCRLNVLAPDGSIRSTHVVESSAGDRGAITISPELPGDLALGARYELSSTDEAPLVAIRNILRLRADEPLPPIQARLGTTRGTNALLTRRGARTGFVTTRGFGDVLKIANQDRPRLFDLAIEKPEPLFTEVAEIDERLAADGSILRAPSRDQVRTALAHLREAGCEAIAICLLHAFRNPAHEDLVAEVARDLGFQEISVSSQLAPLIKIVSRGDTTVMNAYLNPILRDYLARLQASLTTSITGESNVPSLRLMTSAGGLVSADRFVGKDSILSGPAGGVIGFSRVASRAGFAQSIGFDMGGTSTDVARFGGRYEYEYETQKAGVRVVAPMLSIHTVAAGGGSICGFDGVKLFVGPQSAGADPGPACYGKGGPLTVTDVNFFLGRLPEERFPFALDRDAVERRLEALCDEIQRSPLGRDYTAVELAEGYVEIANQSMARAVRKVSVAKGYDPADHVLVTFGGAGGQHACELARLLGIGRVLSHPHAGLLSAYGIGLADVRRFREQAILKPYIPDTLSELEPLLARLTEEATQEVVAEGVSLDQIEPPRVALDLRYAGVESVITVEHPDDGDYAAAYAEQHRRLYGYVHRNRPLEIVAVRVEVIGRMPDPVESEEELVSRRPQPEGVITTVFAGQALETGLYPRELLHAGDEFDGPAIVCEPTSTLVIPPGCTARILARGEVLVDCDESRDEGRESREKKSLGSTLDTRLSTPPDSRPSTHPDPVRLEIFNNLFASIAEQMGLTLQHTSISTNVKERLDFSCAVFDAAGGLVVNAPHIPVHLGAMSETVRRVIADNPDLAPGDVFVTNDPYRGGSHLPDVTVVTPVHDETGQLLFFTASRAHHAEIGGIVPGSMPPFSKNLGEEGVLIRNFRLVANGESREAELRHLLESGPWLSRSVADNLADLSAQVASNAMGAQLLGELIRRSGRDVVVAYMGFIQQAAAAKTRLALSAMNDGQYTFTDHLDDGSPITATITIRGEEATVDFTGTGPVLATNLNANRAIVTAAVLYVFRCLIAEDIPLNSGVLDPVTIILPECLLNPPEAANPADCPAMVGGNVETSQRVVDVLLGALRLAAASQGTMNNLTFGDGTFGYYETICGGSGATSDHDGADAVHTHMTNTRLTDPEVIERRYPVRIHEFAIRRGSGGAGTHRGGDGLVRRIEFLKPLKVSMLSERRGPYAPFGQNGGQPGALGRNTVLRAGTADEIDLGGKFSIDVAPGDVLQIETPGGGGWGDARS